MMAQRRYCRSRERFELVWVLALLAAVCFVVAVVAGTGELPDAKPDGVGWATP